MIYFLDGNQEVIKIVRSSAVISTIQTQELPEDNSLLRDYLSVRLKNDERLFNAQYMAVKSYGGNRNAFDLYRIASEIVPDNATEFMGVQVAPYELEGVVIEDLRPQNRPLNQTMSQVLEGSDWRPGYVADNLPAITTTFYYVSAKDALKSIQELANVEMIFKIEISGNKITDKWVEVYHQLGNRTMKRFNYGTNALSVVRESSHDELYTALIGRGKGEEVGETESGDATYGRKINFADIEWKKSAGNPVGKPKGQKYIELPNATTEYGIKLLDGRKVPRIGIVEFSDTDDPEILIQETYQELLVRARPKVLFKASVINTGDMLIGDTVTIHRHDLDFHYQARVRKVVRDRKNNNKTQVEIGDVVHTPSTKRQGQINSALNNVASDLENVRGEITEARQSADGKNVNNYGNIEPDRKEVGDTWFRDHPSLTGESQILVWNGEAWELIMDTSDTTRNAREIEEKQKLIEEAKERADKAVNEIDVAIASAGFSSLVDMTDSLDGRTTALTANVDSITGIVTNHSGRISTVEQTAAGLQTTVASKASQSQVTQLATAVNSKVSNSDFTSQIGQLSNAINLRVTSTELNSAVSGKADKDKLITQINLSPDTALIQSRNILLDGNVTIRGTAWMDGAVIANASIDGAKITDATIGSAKIANLDADKITGNTTEFVQSAWNDVAGGSVVVTGAGITTTNSDGSKLKMSQGRFWVQNTAGSNLGQFGYINDPNAPLTHYVRIRTSLGTNFAISQVYGDSDTFKDTLRLAISSSGQATMSMQARILMNYEGIYFSDRTDQEQGSIRRVGSTLRVIGPQGGSSSSVAIYGGMGGSSIKAGYTLETYSDGAISNHMWATLDMHSYSITNQSDARLKKEIVKDEIDSLEAIKQWEISGYYWKDNEHSSERQFGIIAQSAPEIAYEGRDGYLNVNSTKQLQMTTHGLQQLEVREENTNKVASQALQATETNAQKIKRLEKRVEELESVA